MEEGKDYLLRAHPTPKREDHWIVILQNAPYNRVCLDFVNVIIGAKEEGRTDRDLKYTYTVAFCPDKDLDLQTEEFKEYVADVIRDVVETHHEKNANIYVSTKTGEQVNE